MGGSVTKPVTKNVSPNTRKKNKIERRKSMSKLKTGTSLTGSYRLPSSSKLSDNYFKSIFSMRTLPRVTIKEVTVLLQCWERHSKIISEALYPGNPERVYPPRLRQFVMDQIEGGDLSFGTLKLSSEFVNLFDSKRNLELSKSALARTIAQVPIVKKLDLFEIGVSENAATQLVMCMEDQIEISGAVSNERVQRALRTERLILKNSPTTSPTKSIMNAEIADGKYVVQAPKISYHKFKALTEALDGKVKLETEPIYYLERLVLPRGSVNERKKKTLERRGSQFFSIGNMGSQRNFNTAEVKSSTPKFSGFDVTEKLTKILKHMDDAGAKLFTCNAKLEARRSFQKIDVDGSGEIDKSELSNALQELGMVVTSELVSDVMKFVDKDESGTVSEEEFVAAIAKRSTRRTTEEKVHKTLVNLVPKHHHKPNCSIHPHSDFMHMWDLIVVFFLFWTSTITIFEICFLEISFEFDFLFIMNRLIDVIFIIDMIMHFFIIIPRKNTPTMITDIRTITLTYLKGMFFIDFVSSIPYDLIGMGSSSDAVGGLRFFRLLRLIRLFKLARIFKSVRIIRRWQDLYGVTVKYSVQQILKFMVFMFIICHWIACLWKFVTIFDKEDSWIVKDEYSEKNTAEMYFICFYWSLQTISTIGYGDVANPTNLTERCIAIVAMIIGSIVWAYLMGVIVSNAVSLNKLEQDHHQRMDNLEVFMGEKQLDPHLRKRLRYYFRRRRSLDTMEQFQDLLRSMSPSLRGDVALSITAKWLPKVPWLRNGEKNFVTSIALNLKPEIYPPTEMISGETFHVISRGIAIKDMRVFCGGMVWGLDMILANRQLRRMKPAIALTFLETSSLSRADFMHVLERFPREKKKVRHTVIWLAFRRKFTAHAQEVEAMTDQLSRVLRRDALNGVMDIRETFKKCDVNGDGELDFVEFSNGLRSIGFNPSHDVLENLMLRFKGENNKDRISIGSFLEFFAVHHRPKRHDLETLPLLQRRKTLLGVTHHLAEQGSIIDADTLKREKSLGPPEQVSNISQEHTRHLMNHSEQIKSLNSELGSMKDMLQVLINKSI
jgi:Ca2+-binding EF-hand superfamily protein